MWDPGHKPESGKPFDLAEYHNQTYELDTPWDALVSYGPLTLEDGLAIVQWPSTYRESRSRTTGRYNSVAATLGLLFSKLPGPPTDEMLLTICGYYDTPSTGIRLAKCPPVRQYLTDELIAALFIRIMDRCEPARPAVFPPYLMTEGVVQRVKDPFPYATAATLSRSNRYENQALLRRYGRELVRKDALALTVMPPEIRAEYNAVDLVVNMVSDMICGAIPGDETRVAKMLKLIPDKSVLPFNIRVYLASVFPSLLKTLLTGNQQDDRDLAKACVRNGDIPAAARALRSLDDAQLTGLFA